MKRMFKITNRALTSVATLALAASVALAQQPQTLKGVVIKGKTPVNKDVLKVALPKAYETKLGNGLQVIVLENHKLPTFTMQMVILSGGLNAPADQPATAQYAATMLREGTKTRASRQIAEAVESLGATLIAGSGLSSLTSTVTAGGLTENFDQIMELFADVILNPSFPAEDLNKLKNRAVAQLRFQRSQPGFLANEMFSKVMYGAHPASRVAPTPAQIQGLTPDLLKQFHAAHYRPNNAIFAIVGDVKPAEIVAKLEKTFGTWQRGDVPQLDLPKVNEPGPSKIYLIDRPGSEQTNLILGNLAIERSDPDYYALDVMNQVLGGGASARLFLNLREDKGYTYGAYSGFSAAKYRGAFRASAEVQTDVTKGSMDEFIYEFKRIRDEKTPADEFDRAKRTIVGSFALQMESPQSLLGNIITQKIYNLPADYWDTYPQKIAAVSVEDVQRIARKYLDLTKLQIVAVGDAKRIADVMKLFGTSELYDTEGKPLQSPASVAPAKTPGSSGDVAAIIGKWNLTANSPDGQLDLKLEIKSKGAEIGGALDTPFGQFPIISASVQGADVTIKVKADLHGNQAEVQIAAKLEGATMKGSLTSTGLPTLDFTGKKAQ
ncbi:MAG TPA: pitrilysin family protein [Blastocatellia bacterium]|nr:pitrilysin family protein [Blastocatellia bacterium]